MILCEAFFIWEGQKHGRLCDDEAYYYFLIDGKMSPKCYKHIPYGFKRTSKRILIRTPELDNVFIAQQVLEL